MSEVVVDQSGRRVPAATPAPDVPAIAHVFGISAMFVAGFGVPALWLISSDDKIDTADKWVMRTVAAGTAVISAPLAAHYLDRLRGKI